SIAAEALEGSDAVVLRITAGSDTVIVTAVSPQAPRERPFAEGGEGSNAGLGLYVTRELARMQGGDLEAEAGPETGARYVLTLPRAQ
ncbi:MAG: hypothetical protein QOI80_199, partial [Solirubrobacteraceae bacterium]|nr:hypothetical protein [Solirubrobacteraceae bacterium]